MSDSYRIKKNGTTLLTLTGVKTHWKDNDKEIPNYRAQIYLENDVINDLAPVHIEEYEEGGPICQLIEKIVPDEQPKPKKVPEKKIESKIAPKQKKVASSKKNEEKSTSKVDE